ncbi:dTDP-4-dehydrorhamnose 3,5-epimerase [Endomicrobium proavitum]|uniref:dTDP-4-dehydrorhamnose 3,5-epimerase n=1 Tax=Endomicrobium proavitum TaxID=1408281 RepID=A0A0G3WJW0_9BACT|nr:dTDP-4-dehydrorhamnose 3,5-epimerase [Endomicrobium proavitum]AKL97789.1 dTDP-4-dehydrorhamnose 3,5-epimerase [Endomicrobium proavitum]
MPFVFKKLEIAEVVLIETQKFGDARGFFTELFKESNFSFSGAVKQINFSKSSKDILRGLHYQLAPFSQSKIVRAVCGKIFDVAVDLRKGSPTFGKWVGEILDSEKMNMLYIPEGFAHGFEVLSESAEVEYFCNREYAPQHERGIKYDDPDINVKWNVKKPLVSQKDAKYPFLKDAEINF